MIVFFLEYTDKDGNDVQVIQMGTTSETKNAEESEEYMNSIKDLIENQMFQGFSEHFKNVDFGETSVLIPPDFETFQNENLSSAKKVTHKKN